MMQSSFFQVDVHDVIYERRVYSKLEVESLLDARGSSFASAGSLQRRGITSKRRAKDSALIDYAGMEGLLHPWQAAECEAQAWP